jgi:hypothetical protein
MPDQTPRRRRRQTRDVLNIGMGEGRLAILIESGCQLGGPEANRLRRRWAFGTLNLTWRRIARLLHHDDGLCAFRAMPQHEVRTSHNARPRRTFQEG